MELDGKLLQVDVGTNLEGMEGKETRTSNVSGRNELDYCPRCVELEKKCKEAEARCCVLELEIEREKRGFELLQSKIAIVTLDKLEIEDEVRILEKGKKELENKITNIENSNMATAEEVKGPQVGVDSTEEGDKVFELMMENNVLNVEVGVWKAKFKDLELRVAELEKRLYSKDGECASNEMVKVGLVSSRGGKEISEVNELQDGFHGAVTPVAATLISNVAHDDGAERGTLRENEMEYGSQAQKKLVFEEGTPSRKMAPVTPASARPPPVCSIDISDSDDEANTTKFDIEERKKSGGLTDGMVSMDGKELPSKSNSTWSPDQSDEDDVPHCNRRASSLLTAKRKRAFNMVTSDSGSDTDDNFPICRIRTDYPHESSVPSPQKSISRTAAASENKNGKPVPRRRLVPLRKQCGIPINGTSAADETEEDESDAEDESLDGFIVDSSDSEGDNASKDDEPFASDERSASGSDDASDSNMDYGDIITRIGRRKDHLVKWGFEADMLAAFGKDPDLCMKAVCALYRKQTSEEKFNKATIFANRRGFSQSDATRGSILGEFLTDGDPLGDLKKSVKELKEHNSKGVELCRTLATHYSKQLFEMYKNKEDPLWPSLGPN